MEIETIEVCEQCILVHSNGCESDQDFATSELIAQYEDETEGVLAICDDKEESFFSCDSCAICDALPGDRYNINVLYA